MGRSSIHLGNTLDEEEDLSMTQSEHVARIPRKNVRAKKSTPGRTRSLKFQARNFVRLKVNEELQDAYEVHEMIGEGGFGEVFRCTHRATGSERAVKVMARSRVEDENAEVRNEFAVVNALDHPNLIKQYNMYESDDKFRIVTDIYKGGEMMDYLDENGHMSESDVACLMNHLLMCVNYFHGQGIAHRDLKPENILLSGNKKWEDLKVIDFGLAKYHDPEVDEPMQEVWGTPYYCSPQVLEGEYTKKCDIWSCGTIAFVALCGEACFDGETNEDIVQWVLTNDWGFDQPIWSEISEEAKDFVSKLLTFEEDERPSAAEALNHPWLVKGRQDISKGVMDCEKKRSSMMSSLRGMQSFKATSKLSQATYALLSSQMLPKEARAEIDEMFRVLDDDCSGALTKDEVQEGFAKFYNKHLTDAEVDTLFDKVNFSGSGAIEYSEFVCACLMETDVLSEKSLKNAFNEFDLDGSGSISIDELKQVFAGCGGEVDDEMINLIIAQIDDNGDGEIDFEEFKVMMSITAAQPDKETLQKWDETRKSMNPQAQAALKTLQMVDDLSDSDDEEMPEDSFHCETPVKPTTTKPTPSKDRRCSGDTASSTTRQEDFPEFNESNSSALSMAEESQEDEPPALAPMPKEEPKKKISPNTLYDNQSDFIGGCGGQPIKKWTPPPKEEKAKTTNTLYDNQSDFIGGCGGQPVKKWTPPPREEKAKTTNTLYDNQSDFIGGCGGKPVRRWSRPPLPEKEEPKKLNTLYDNQSDFIGGCGAKPVKRWTPPPKEEPKKTNTLYDNQSDFIGGCAPEPTRRWSRPPVPAPAPEEELSKASKRSSVASTSSISVNSDITCSIAEEPQPVPVAAPISKSKSGSSGASVASLSNSSYGSEYDEVPSFPKNYAAEAHNKRISERMSKTQDELKSVSVHERLSMLKSAAKSATVASRLMGNQSESDVQRLRASTGSRPGLLESDRMNMQRMASRKNLMENQIKTVSIEERRSSFTRADSNLKTRILMGNQSEPNQGNAGWEQLESVSAHIQRVTDRKNKVQAMLKKAPSVRDRKNSFVQAADNAVNKNVNLSVRDRLTLFKGAAKNATIASRLMGNQSEPNVHASSSTSSLLETQIRRAARHDKVKDMVKSVSVNNRMSIFQSQIDQNKARAPRKAAMKKRMSVSEIMQAGY